MADVLNAMDITYCEGARLLQDSQADLGSILIQRPNGGLVCQHCYLVVADANDVKSIAPDQDWPLLVSCHVQACVSMHDRRAAYSCYACLERGKTSVETSMAALRRHLNVCELIRDIKLHDQHLRRQATDGTRPASSAGRRNGKKPELTSQPTRSTQPQTAESAWSASSNPFKQTLGMPPPATPVQQNKSQNPSAMPEPTPALPARPKERAAAAAAAQTQAERMYTPPSSARRGAEQQPTFPPPNPRINTNAGDQYTTIPGGFPNNHQSDRDSIYSVSSQTDPSAYAAGLPMPRRKEIKPDHHNHQQQPSTSSHDRTSSGSAFPNPPTRAPPAPPLLSQPQPQPQPSGAQAPPSYGPATSHPNPFSMNPPTSAGPGAYDSFSRPESAKVAQLVSLGIPAPEAEGLLMQTGGDVNAAAELRFSNPAAATGLQPGVLPSPRRERRSRE